LVGISLIPVVLEVIKARRKNSGSKKTN